jgi:hypothetical protein
MTTKSIYNGLGYVMNDNRSSGGKLVEDDVLGCGHCQTCINRANWKAYGENRCFSCDEAICSICLFEMKNTGCGCQNFKRAFERAIEDRYRREQNAKVLGT